VRLGWKGAQLVEEEVLERDLSVEWNLGEMGEALERDKI
jgi:hypothetical protein